MAGRSVGVFRPEQIGQFALTSRNYPDTEAWATLYPIVCMSVCLWIHKHCSGSRFQRFPRRLDGRQDSVGFGDRRATWMDIFEVNGENGESYPEDVHHHL